MSRTAKRLAYLAAFLLFTAAEVLIALFVHDRFVRPYVGDMLVVIVLYCLVRVFLPEGAPLLPLFVFLFAAGVECLQLAGLADRLSIENAFLRTLVGTTFDWLDILCYAAGCGVLAVYQWIVRRLTSRLNNNSAEKGS